jgi:hypothetical protein
MFQTKRRANNHLVHLKISRFDEASRVHPDVGANLPWRVQRYQVLLLDNTFELNLKLGKHLKFAFYNAQA